MSKRNTLAVLTLAAVSLVFLACPAGAAELPTTYNFAAHCEVNEDVVVGFSKLFDHTEFWSANLSGTKSQIVAKSEFLSYVGSQENDADYVLVGIYMDDGAVWEVSEQTQIVLVYEDARSGERKEVASVALLFVRRNPQIPDVVTSHDDILNIPGKLQEVFNSAEEKVVLASSCSLDKTGKGGIICYARFKKGSLPRPLRFLWWGGNDWGWTPPDHVEIRTGGSDALAQRGGE